MSTGGRQLRSERPRARLLQTPLGATAVVSLPVFVGLGVVITGALLSGRPPGHFTRDPLAIARLPPHLGALSNLGVLLWAVSVGVWSLAGMVLLLRGPALARRAWFCLCFGAFTGFMALDDVFMLHERIFPINLGVPEPLVLGSYVSLALVLLAAFHRTIRDTSIPLLVCTGTLFAGSLLVDQRQSDLVWWTMLEDGFKFLGIGAWLAYALSASVAWIAPADESPVTGQAGEADRTRDLLDPGSRAGIDGPPAIRRTSTAPRTPSPVLRGAATRSAESGSLREPTLEHPGGGGRPERGQR